MTIYRVCGPFRYRDHDVGEVFEASLDPDVEERAVMRGSIEIVDRRKPGLQPGSYTPPVGWRSQRSRQREHR